MTQSIGICRFSAKAKIITETAKNLNTACGKTFRRGQSTGYRKFQYQIRAAQDGGFGTEGLVYNGGHAPLDKIAAHEANNGGIFSQKTANDLKLLHMTLVQGIVFTDDSDLFQKIPSFS